MGGWGFGSGLEVGRGVDINKYINSVSAVWNLVNSL